MKSEAARNADFSRIRYAQCWEDADVLLSALEIQPEHACLSIASAGDNALSMLSQGPARVIALDLNPAQLACLELRVAAFRELQHHELLELIGSRSSVRRSDLYRKCRLQLNADTREFWDRHPKKIAQGIGGAGKFENYFSLFRNRILPLVHSRTTVAMLLRGRTAEERKQFYEMHWNTWRWRLLFKIFFSRLILGRMGRDPSFFKYVEGEVAKRILARTRYALTELNPADNPYLHWILRGCHGRVLPHALREENFDSIRAHLDRLEYRCESVEEYCRNHSEGPIDRFNLSDIFEYMSSHNYYRLLEVLISRGRSGGRMAYWNMLAKRRQPTNLTDRLKPLSSLANSLFRQDRAFFYSDFVVEEIQ